MDDYTPLLQSINQIVSLSNQETIRALKDFKKEILKKGDFFLKEGEVCDKVCFITQGSMMYFNLKDESEEIAMDFVFDGEWATYNQSRLSKRPSKISIKALEGTELLVIKDEDLYKLYDQVPKFDRVGRVLMEHSFVEMAQRNEDFQILSAEERYLKLMNEKPIILQRVPLYHIANYLGINPKSLSRIRKEISQAR